jgi:putative acyl-CoA dehydrogenase
MQNVLADLAVESEAATLTAMRLARAVDEGPDDPAQTLFKRLGLAVSKYWVCKSATWHVTEALECLGGNGYVELSGMPRIHREAPLNSIWEGSGNVNCLDVLRAMARTPESVQAFFDEVESASGAEPRLDAYVREVKAELGDPEGIEARARRIVERMAVALQASLLVRFGDPAVADAFCASRLAGDRGRALGTLPAGVDFERIIGRHSPAR